jgi:VanZ family protein
LAALLYAAFVVYGSLVPLEFRPVPLEKAWAAFLRIPYLKLGVASRADWVANILLYIPLAFFLTGALAGAGRSARIAVGAITTIVFCLALAFAVEFAQLFFPPRTVSQNDLIAETIGTLLGVGLWVSAGERILGLAAQAARGGALALRAEIVLYVIGYLGLSLFPFDFLVSGSELSAKLAGAARPAWTLSESCGGVLRCNAKLFAEILLAAPLGMLYGMLRGRGSAPRYGRALFMGLALGATIEVLQIFLASGVSQGLSIVTRGLGTVWGLALYRSVTRDWFVRHRATLEKLAWVAAPFYALLLLALKGLLPPKLEPLWAATDKLAEVRFLPFYYHYFTTETEALQSLLLNAGVYAPVGVLVWLASGPHRRGSTPWTAVIVGGVLAVLVETLNLFAVGKRPDPTNVLIAGAACYFVAWAAQRLEHGLQAQPRETVARESRRALTRTDLALAVTSVVVLAAVAVGSLVVATPQREKYVDESVLPRLPPGRDLPPVSLPNFRVAHPRLPHPTPEDLAMLRAQNPGFLETQRRQARSGQGDLYAAILTEFVEPGSQDLDALIRRLLAIKVEWRGHDQAKPIVQAYDWLYDRWNEAQRLALRDKVVEACNHMIEVIRVERHSPYNVILYNAPFQALVACAIALYRDDERGEPVMRFTYDLWKHRVLPVWRQVMGKNGGWHEGGEYVGIGIGQAVYRVPAMWRYATGEDVFATELGIRGFLDFLVYRKQPDGTDFRWGDGAYFDRIVPDAIPLALEFRHPAAYNLRPPRGAPVPTSWPWGPLTDDTLIDRDAAKQMPLAYYADGIGLVVARTDWSPDATYVTFKAGDNYWSHGHLDQGAFTIYKGGPLAIDSGLYGPQYGSDHHMNYDYQTIAHNTITVADPRDTVPAPGKEKPRPIANDGGQRRIGSGWGVEPAPLDLAEWNAKRETYHTGSIEKLIDRNGIVAAVADLTPAYTNALSGKGTFSHRTRRVERFRRVFGYDRIDDVVVVYDDVRATDAEFRKRWLLHTVEQPMIGNGSFTVLIGPSRGAGRGGGQLEGRVLFPERNILNVIGGRGFEFFVGDRNYDEGGKVLDIARRRGPGGPEPGAWRIELIPEAAAQEDEFLVVLLPSLPGEPPGHAVRRIRDGTRIGCEITGPTRTTRWLFDREQGLADLSITARASRER